MTTEHDVLKWLKDTHPDIYKRIFAKSGGRQEDMIRTLIDILDKGSVRK